MSLDTMTSYASDAVRLSTSTVKLVDDGMGDPVNQVDEADGPAPAWCLRPSASCACSGVWLPYGARTATAPVADTCMSRGRYCSTGDKNTHPRRCQPRMPPATSPPSGLSSCDSDTVLCPVPAGKWDTARSTTRTNSRRAGGRVPRHQTPAPPATHRRDPAGQVGQGLGVLRVAMAPWQRPTAPRGV